MLRSIAAAPEASLHLIDSGLVSTLLNLLRTQQEDDEFVLQVSFDFLIWFRFCLVLFLLLLYRSFMFSIAYCVMMKFDTSSSIKLVFKKKQILQINLH